LEHKGNHFSGIFKDILAIFIKIHCGETYFSDSGITMTRKRKTLASKIKTSQSQFFVKVQKYKKPKDAIIAIIQYKPTNLPSKI
jgi:hypothetical protein